jgi:hypothetical protein
MNDATRERVVKLFRVPGSDNVYERDVARSKIDDILRRHNKTWNDLQDILKGEKPQPEPKASPPPPPRPEPQPPPRAKPPPKEPFAHRFLLGTLAIVSWLVVLAQIILNVFGWFFIIGGCIGLLFGNRERGLELLLSGVGLIVLKYVIGFAWAGLLYLGASFYDFVASRKQAIKRLALVGALLVVAVFASQQSSKMQGNVAPNVTVPKANPVVPKAVPPKTNPAITVIPAGESTQIYLKGDIELNAADRFEEATRNLPSSSFLILASGGGSLREMVLIGRLVRKRGFSTWVPPNEACLSACALIWLAGTEKAAADTARIGFHQAYDDAKRETVAGNAAVASYLRELGYGYGAIEFVTSAPPEGMRWLLSCDPASIHFTVVTATSRVKARKCDEDRKVTTTTESPVPPSQDTTRERPSTRPPMAAIIPTVAHGVWGVAPACQTTIRIEATLIDRGKTKCFPVEVFPPTIIGREMSFTMALTCSRDQERSVATWRVGVIPGVSLTIEEWRAKEHEWPKLEKGWMPGSSAVTKLISCRT